MTFPFSYRKTTTLPSLTAVLRPLSTRQRPDEPQPRDTTEAQGRLTPQPHARISSDIRPCFLFLVHPIAFSASDEPFFISPPHRAPESAHRAHRQVRENRPMARAPQTITPTAAPKSGHRAARSLTRSPKLGTPEHDRRNHRPKALPFSLLETPQNHPFARPAKAASINSYSKPAISYNAPPKVLPRRARCLLLHCHQDSNEIQIKK